MSAPSDTAAGYASRGGGLTLMLTMGSDEARQLAKMLIERADEEDAQPDEDEDED